MIKSAIVAAALAAVLSGCAVHSWAPGPEANESFGVVSGKCKLAAEGSRQGFMAMGAPTFVVSASLGNAIGNAVRGQNIYNDCMEAEGFVVVDR